MLTAITGGIAEGKTTVLSILTSMGFICVSADEIARRLFDEPEINASLALVAGVPYPVDRPTIRALILENPAIRRKVNLTMHHRIMESVRRSAADFVEIPLLIECCLHVEFKSVWVVTCGVEEQRARLLARYGGSSEIEKILAAQLPTNAKVPFADVVIRTNSSLQSVRRDISKALASRFEAS